MSFSDESGGHLGGGYPPGGPGLPASADQAPAWDNFESEGLFKSLCRTIGQVSLHPGETFRAMAPTGYIGRAFFFALLISVPPALVGQLTGKLWESAFQNMLPEMPASENPYDSFLDALGIFAIPLQFMVAMFVVAIMLPIQAAIFHLFLFLFGAANRTFASTFRVVCYSEGATALWGIIPCAGALIALVWKIVCLVTGLSEQNGISLGKAAAVVLLPALLFMCCCCIGVFVFLSLLGSMQ